MTDHTGETDPFTEYDHSTFASVAGSDTQIQYNNGGSFGGDDSLIFDDVNKRLGVGVGPTESIHTGGNILATGTVLGSNLSGSNSGDQASIVGITGTKAQFNTVVTDDIGSTVQAYDADTLKADATDELTAGFGITPSAIGSAASATPDYQTRNLFTWTVSGTGNLVNPTNHTAGVRHMIATIDGTGAYTTTFGAVYNIVSGTWDDTAGAVNILTFVSDGTTIFTYITQKV